MAARFYEPSVIRIEQVDKPEIRRDEILVRNRVALTCGSDLKMYLRGHRLVTPPLVIGHEFAGTIEKIARKSLKCIQKGKVEKTTEWVDLRE